MKTMARQIGTVLCMALALLSAFYAFAVMKTHSGTGFWKVWLVIAAVFALLAVGIAANWWVALPRIIRGVIIAVVCIGIAIFGTVEGCIISNMHARGDLRRPPRTGGLDGPHGLRVADLHHLAACQNRT